VSKAVDSIDGVRAYLDALDPFDVFRGGEFCWHDSLWRELPDDLNRRFTHRIGSLHAITLANGTLVHAFSRRLPPDLTPDAYMGAHLDTLERFAREMPVDILAHPTLVSIPFRHLDPERLWTEAREERAVTALRDANIAFEFSNRYPPHPRIARRAVTSGLRISLGSDGHTRDQVADVAAPLALARSLGVRDEDLYDPARHGSKTSAASARP
jgi:histidinol phosphatase-like PHP family hydrolase